MNRKNKLEDLLLLLLLAPCLICLFGCQREKPTSVRVGAGPSFALTGSGRLASFTVSAPLAGQRVAFPCNKLLFACPNVAAVVWQIEPSRGYFNGARVEELQMRYGQLPDGYIQTAPSQSRPVPPLPPGVIYAFSAETANAAGQSGYFYVDRSGAVQVVEISDLCVTLKSGQEVKVNCTTKDPYQEPTDLEKFVREHRKQ